MNIETVLKRVEQLKPNSTSESILRSLIEEIDHKIYTEIVAVDKPNEDEIIQPESERYPFGNENIELLAKDEYSNLYVYYLMAHIDFYNGEYERYNNEMIMFNNEMAAYSAWYTRTHKSKMPLKLEIS